MCLQLPSIAHVLALGLHCDWLLRFPMLGKSINQMVHVFNSYLLFLVLSREQIIYDKNLEKYRKM